MITDDTAPSLRITDRKRLLGHLLELGAPSVERRAKAALAATNMLQAKGLSWQTLLPPEHGDDGDQQLPSDWRAQIRTLLTNPALTPADTHFLRKIIAWKSPGADGLAQLRVIADRVAGRPKPHAPA